MGEINLDANGRGVGECWGKGRVPNCDVSGMSCIAVPSRRCMKMISDFLPKDFKLNVKIIY